MSNAQFDIIIVGGGIIGCSTLHQLAKRAVLQQGEEEEEEALRLLLLEATPDVATQASGKAGGFLASQWCDDETPGKSMQHLSRIGFDMHKEFAREVGAETIQFREMSAFSASLSRYASISRNLTKSAKQNQKQKSDSSSSSSFLDGAAVCQTQQLVSASQNTTAQVHPKLLCQTMIREAFKYCAAGNKKVEVQVKTNMFVRKLVFKEAKVVGVVVQKHEEGKREQQEDEEFFHARKAVVLTQGPWSQNAASLLPSSSSSSSSTQKVAKVLTQLASGCYSNKVNSVLLKTSSPLSPHAIFTSAADPSSNNSEEDDEENENENNENLRLSFEPEIYPRPDGTTYVCGGTDYEKLPENPNHVSQCIESSCETLVKIAGAVSSQLEKSKIEVVGKQQCFLPYSGKQRLPIIGPVPYSENSLFFATGTFCWGILISHAVGLALAEMLLLAKTTTTTRTSRVASKVTECDPKNFIDEDEQEGENNNQTKRKNTNW